MAGRKSKSGNDGVGSVDAPNGDGDSFTFDDGREIPVIEPASVTGGGTDSAAEPKRRGRKPGSKNKAKATLDLSGTEKILLSAHAMLAAMTKVEEFELDETEANKLASAVTEVGKHYSVVADEKTQAWINLVFACGAVYGPRIMAYRIRTSRERRPTGGPVIDMTGRTVG